MTLCAFTVGTGCTDTLHSGFAGFVPATTSTPSPNTQGELSATAKMHKVVMLVLRQTMPDSHCLKPTLPYA